MQGVTTMTPYSLLLEKMISSQPGHSYICLAVNSNTSEWVLQSAEILHMPVYISMGDFSYNSAWAAAIWPTPFAISKPQRIFNALDNAFRHSIPTTWRPGEFIARRFTRKIHATSDWTQTRNPQHLR